MALLFSFLPMVEYFSLIAHYNYCLHLFYLPAVLNKDLKGLIYLAGLMISHYNHSLEEIHKRLTQLAIYSAIVFQIANSLIHP